MARDPRNDWQTAALRRLRRILKEARAVPALAERRGLDREKPWRAGLRFVSSPEMARLNRRYRGKYSVTDVLSFPSPTAFEAFGDLGDLVICGPVLRHQAREAGHSPETELTILLVHGVLHLLGWDHERGAREAAEMARWEDRLLALTRPVPVKKRLTGLIGRSS